MGAINERWTAKQWSLFSLWLVPQLIADHIASQLIACRSRSFFLWEYPGTETMAKNYCSQDMHLEHPN